MFYKLSFLKAQSIRQVTCNFTAIDCFDDVVPLFVSAALAVCVYKLSFTTGRHTHRSKRTDTGFCRFHTYGLGARDIPLEKRGACCAPANFKFHFHALVTTRKACVLESKAKIHKAMVLEGLSFSFTEKSSGPNCSSSDFARKTCKFSNDCCCSPRKPTSGRGSARDAWETAACGITVQFHSRWNHFLEIGPLLLS